MRLRMMLTIVGLIAMSACSSGAHGHLVTLGSDNPFAPAGSQEIRDAVAAFRPGEAADHVDRSALDSLTEGRRSELAPGATRLVELLPSPDGFGSFRLALLQVDDPNGDGRIGEYWYPPRILRQQCSTKVDAAPGPFALASYVPGSGPLEDTGPGAGFDVMSAAVAVAVQVQLFDDASQRDAYLATTLAFFRDPTFTCGGNTASVQTYRESTLSSAGVPAIVFEAEPAIFGTGVSAYATVGDRVLLTVSVSSDDVDAPWGPDDIDRWLAPVVDVALERLDVAELP